MPARPLRHLTRRLALAGAVSLALVVAAPLHAADKRSFTEAASDAANKMWTGAQDVTFYALSLIGVKYKFGGNTPESGLDCSGLVRYVFQQVTGVTLPRTSREMSGVGDKVSLADLAPGDLVFFNTRRFANSHVGIYLGDNRFIHAPSRGGDVEIATFTAAYWQKRFNGARRLVGSMPSLMPSLVSTATAAPLEAPSSPGPSLSSFALSPADVTP